MEKEPLALAEAIPPGAKECPNCKGKGSIYPGVECNGVHYHFIGTRPMIIIKEVYPCKVCNGMGYTAKTWPEDKLSLNPPKTTEKDRNKIPKSIKDQVNALGNERGCHSCGTRTPGTSDGHWIPDHVPPIALSVAIVKQFFGLTKLEIPDYPPGGWYLLPHCQSCSRKQGPRVKYIKYKLVDIVKKKCTRHKQ